MWDSKYLVSIFPRRHCDHQCHNGNPDEEHMQLLSLNKISQFPLHPGTMGLSPGRWLSSYSPGAIIAAKPLPPTTLTQFTPLPSSAFINPRPTPSLTWVLDFCHILRSFHPIFTLPLRSSSPSIYLSFIISPLSLSNLATLTLTLRGKSERYQILIWSMSGYF